MENDQKVHESVLVVAAHPDDEALGCAGALSKHKAEGAAVTLLFLSDGEGARPIAAQQVHARAKMANEAAKLLSTNTPITLDYPDNKFDSEPLLKIVKSVECVISEVNPTLIYTHHPGDLNLDHRMAFQATLTACRPIENTIGVELRTFEVLSSTDWSCNFTGSCFAPNTYVEVSKEHLNIKKRAIEIYQNEMRPIPHSRNLETVMALARLRGAEVGVEFAEAFTSVRRLIR